jgi:hypothetical protein
LPTAHPLIEITDGKHITSDRIVTGDEFEAYLATNPDRYTIRGLLEFVDGEREKAGKAP